MKASNTNVFQWMRYLTYVILTPIDAHFVRRETLRDRDDLSTKDTCFNPILIHFITSEIGMTPLQGTKIIVGLIVSFVDMFQCKGLS